MDFVSRCMPADAETGGSTTALIAGTAVVTAVGVTLLRSALWPPKPKVLEGPLRTVLPKLSEKELDALEYKPDEFPGARDVSTPYGSIRVYEWGPESGPKVLFIHGITTTCQTMGPIAHALVAKGCRVMLFDLFGRGFSDGVGDLPHDARLYVTQALLALASSPLPWTGAGALRLVGYSMGGGVAAHFAATFPDLVDRLVLLAPAGLIQLAKFGAVTRFIFRSGFVPDVLLTNMTRKRLQRPIAAGVRRKPGASGPVEGEEGWKGDEDEDEDGDGDGDERTPLAPHFEPKQDPIAASLTEAVGTTPPVETTPLEKKVLSYVQWMVRHHGGFVPAFIGSLQAAPLVEQHDAWRRLAARPKGSTLVVMGRTDEIVDADDYEAEGLPLLGGRERVKWTVVPGGHDFPMTRVNETLREIYTAWGME